MKINANMIKTLRTNKNWSQEQLSELSGLSLRTIQRLESGSNASIESLKVLAATFEVDPNLLMIEDKQKTMTPIDAVIIGFREYANFTGKATRYEYWWFLLFITLIIAVATILSEKAGQIADVILLVPLLAAGSRRLNDTGQSGWWQLFFFVPFGVIIVLILMAEKGGKTKANA